MISVSNTMKKIELNYFDICPCSRTQRDSDFSLLREFNQRYLPLILKCHILLIRISHINNGSFMPDDSTCIMLLLFQRSSLSKNLNLNGFSSIKKCLLWERDIYVCVCMCVCIICMYLLPWWLRGKESIFNMGDIGAVGLILGSGRSPGEGHGNPLQYSCQENPMDREAKQATVHGVAKRRD